MILPVLPWGISVYLQQSLTGLRFTVKGARSALGREVAESRLCEAARTDHAPPAPRQSCRARLWQRFQGSRASPRTSLLAELWASAAPAHPALKPVIGCWKHRAPLPPPQRPAQAAEGPAYSLMAKHKTSWQPVCPALDTEVLTKNPISHLNFKESPSHQQQRERG